MRESAYQGGGYQWSKSQMNLVETNGGGVNTNGRMSHHGVINTNGSLLHQVQSHGNNN